MTSFLVGVRAYWDGHLWTAFIVGARVGMAVATAAAAIAERFRR